MRRCTASSPASISSRRLMRRRPGAGPRRRAGPPARRRAGRSRGRRTRGCTGSRRGPRRRAPRAARGRRRRGRARECPTRSRRRSRDDGGDVGAQLLGHLVAAAAHVRPDPALDPDGAELAHPSHRRRDDARHQAGTPGVGGTDHALVGRDQQHRHAVSGPDQQRQRRASWPTMPSACGRCDHSGAGQRPPRRRAPGGGRRARRPGRSRPAAAGGSRPSPRRRRRPRSPG